MEAFVAGTVECRDGCIIGAAGRKVGNRIACYVADGDRCVINSRLGSDVDLVSREICLGVAGP